MAELQHSDVPGRPGAPGAVTEVAPGREDGRAGYSTMTEDGFSGWGWFAGGLLGLVGLFQVMAGTVALASVEYYTAPERSLLVDADYTTWGWVHLVLGLVALVVGGG